MSDDEADSLPDIDPLLEGADPDITVHEAVVPEDAEGARCDRWLAEQFPDISRSRIKALILNGSIQVDGQTVDEPKTAVKPGSRFIVTLPPPVEATPQPQAIALSVVYEDAHLIVIDKPTGMAVHPAPGSYDGTLVNALLAHCAGSLSGIGGVARPGIVHRLDKDTSGLIVCAKTDAAHAGLSAQFAAHTAGRVYQAICWGTPSPAEDVIDAAIGRDPRQRKRMAVVGAVRGGTGPGKHAITHYRLSQRLGLGASLITCQLETGRTHQIRVHLTHIGHPLLGDPLYGKITSARRAKLSDAGRAALEAFQRQALHAAALDFDHPATGEAMHFESPLPADMEELIDGLSKT